MATTVVNIRTYKSKDVLWVGRPSIFGNPFVIGKDGTREEVIEKYKKYITTRPDILKLIPTLKNRKIGCVCKPLACHADILAELADKEENIEKDKDEQN